MEKAFAPATERNREPILRVLRPFLPFSGTVLEIASGTGQHAMYFAEKLAPLRWQPSDASEQALESIRAWAKERELPNLLPPLKLNVLSENWHAIKADAIVCINMIHISPREAIPALMRGAANVLPPGAPLFLYGPFLTSDRPVAPSNWEFDRYLRDQNPCWGVRDLEEVKVEAGKWGISFHSVIEMPANNLSVVFYREAPTTS